MSQSKPISLFSFPSDLLSFLDEEGDDDQPKPIVEVKSPSVIFQTATGISLQDGNNSDDENEPYSNFIDPELPRILFF